MAGGTAQNPVAMSLTDRLAIVVRKAAALLPGDISHHVLLLLSPSALATAAVVIGIWAGAHFIGIGEIADVVLLVAGWIAIGSGALAGARKLVAFAYATTSARSASDLDRAARDLADAITILGIDVVLGLLLRSKPNGTFREPYRPNVTLPRYQQFISVMPKAGPTRMYEAKLIFSRARDAGQGGTRTVDNTAIVGRRFYPEAKPLREAVLDVRQTTYHEVVHQRLTQAFSLLGRPALYMRMGAYKRSYILRYVEEAAAEAYGLARSGGARPGSLTGMQFPLNGNYGITIAKMGQEAKGILLGPVVVGLAGGTACSASFGILE